MSLLAQLAEAEALSPLDVRFAEAVGRLGAVGELTVLGAAAVSRAWSAGHTCLDLGDAGRMLAREVAAARAERGEEAVALPELPEAGAWAEALEADALVVRAPSDARITPLVLDGRRLYVDRAWRQESALVAAVRARSGAAPSDFDAARLAADLDLLFPPGSPGTDRQRVAAEASVRRTLTVISGGPGTGKTATVAKVLALLARQARGRGERDPAVVLVAPTGKAAARLSASIRAQAAWLGPHGEGVPSAASTLHRALGVRPDAGVARRSDDPLRADVVVVDESSMVDLALMALLLDAVPAHARLILLGDPEQLAPVEAGSVLGDLCAAARGGALADTVVTLDHSWRYAAGSGIDRLARAIRAGDDAAAMAALHDPSGAVEWIGLPEGSGGAALEGPLRSRVTAAHRLVTAASTPAEALLAAGAFRVLCAHRRGSFGVDALNPRIERWLADAGIVRPDAADYPGRPVMVLANDERIRLYNGDTGVLAAGPDGRLRAWFGDASGLRDFAPARLPRHETVYASTVHKAQGSEHDHVVVVLPSEASPIVTRELLYTAVTRARRQVTVIGAERVLREGVREPVARSSGLRERLAAPGAGPGA